MESVLALILAGGRGRRMDILCHTRPKPILPFAGSNRVIDFVLSNCIHSQLKHIAVLTDYRRSAMWIYLRSWFLKNGNLCTSGVLEPRHGSYLGTADAIYQNLGYVEYHSSDVVIVLAGDHIYKMDYRKMVAFHRQTGADATVGVVKVPMREAYRFGIVTPDGDGRIVDFVEKPRIPRSNLASMGIYIFNKQVLIERLIEDYAQPNSPRDFGRAVVPNMVKRDKVVAYEFDSHWRDIGTPVAYYQSNMEILGPRPLLSCNGGWPVLSKFDNTAPARKSQQSRIENSIISPGCVVKGRVENSILSPNVWIEEDVVVRNSIVMANSFVGCHSVIDHCVLSEGVNIGKFCYLGFEGSSIPDSWKVTIVGEDVTVPPYTAICRNCKIVPNIGAGDFTERVVPSDSILSSRQGLTEPSQKLEKEVFANVGRSIRTS